MGRVCGVEFGLFSETEIEKLSAVRVDSAIISKAGIVSVHGVNDARLGSSTESMLCSTCACTMEVCPGHSGHIKLFECIFNVELLSFIHKVLTCVCFYCCRLLLPIDHPHYKTIVNTQNKKQRLVDIYEVCKKYRKCCSWLQPTNCQQNYKTESFTLDELTNVPHGVLGCGGLQPVYHRTEISITPVFALTAADLDPDCQLPTCTPTDIYRILQYISPEDCIILGFKPGVSEPASMMWSSFLVPSVAMRPSKSQSGSKIRCEDDLTIKLRQIVKTNEILAKDTTVVNLAEYVVVDGDQQQLLPTTAMKGVMLKYLEVQRAVACYQDSKYASVSNDTKDYGVHRKSVRHRFTAEKAKRGRVRNSILGKRMDFSARTVITPDSFIEVDEVGVPIWMCMHLTYPEKVNQYNIHRLVACVRNGPTQHPGANFLLKTNQVEISLAVVDPWTIQLEYGWVVKRHLVAGDLVLFNRQPSLHKVSLMAHKVKPIAGNSFRLHVACTAPYNADFDGDEMNLSVLMDEFTRAEGQTIMSVQQNMVKDAVPVVCFQQHAVLAAYLLTADGVTLSRATAQQLWYQHQHLDYDRLPAQHASYTGREVFQACLPAGFTCGYDEVVIRNGVYLQGQLKKQSLNKGVLYSIWKDYGGRRAIEFIGGVQRLLECYLSVRGLSIGPTDCNILQLEQIQPTLVQAETYVNRMDTHEPCTPGRVGEKREQNICLVLDKCRDIIGDMAIQRATHSPNGLFDMIDSGAKGNLTNIIQTSGILGQQRNHLCMRIPEVLTCFQNNGERSKTHGFIGSSFIQGLKPFEYFHHLVGSRVGLVDTAVKTSETGYCQRKISKALEDVTVRRDKVVRDCHDNIIQFVYGQDGFDSTFLESNKIRYVHLSETAIQAYYGTADSVCLQSEVQNLLALKQELLKHGLETPKYLCPVNFERLLNGLPTREVGVSGQWVQDKVLRTWQTIERNPFIQKTLLLKSVFFDWCSTAELVVHRRLDLAGIETFLNGVVEQLIYYTAPPNESIGLIASQNCSEPLTQMTLNRFHQSGQFTNLVAGVTRMKEIINAVKQPTAPQMKLYGLPGTVPEELGKQLVHRKLAHFVTHWSNTPPDLKRDQYCKGFWPYWSGVPPANIRYVTFHLHRPATVEYGWTPVQIASAIRASAFFSDSSFDRNVYLSYSATASPHWWVTFSSEVTDHLWQEMESILLKKKMPTSADLVGYMIYEKLINHTTLGGLVGVDDFYVDQGVVITKGSNLLGVLDFPGFNPNLTVCNCMTEIEKMLGIDAACQCIEDELISVMAINKAHVSHRHIQILASTMCYRGSITPMTYQGIAQESTSVMKKAAFEKAMDSFIVGAVRGHVDNCQSVTDAITWNSRPSFGTGAVQLVQTTEPHNYPRGAWFKSRHVVYPAPSVTSLFQPVEPLDCTLVPTTDGVKLVSSIVFFTPHANAAFIPSSPSFHPISFLCPIGSCFVPSSPI